MSRFSSSDGEGGVFGSIKSRLGFGSKGSDDRRGGRGSRSDDYRDYDDYDYDYDDYDDARGSDNRDWDRGGASSSRSSRYDSYDDYDSYDNSYSARGSRYDGASSDRYAPIDTPYSARRSGGDMPSLVTREDIKMSTPLPEIPAIDPIGDDADLYSAPQYNEPADAQPQRSDSLDSLFNPSASSGVVRTLKVIKPVSYEDAEGVARGIKAGSVVVLALRNTPDDLAKRILDFSFGAASALDANVECPGDKVFAIAKGRALGEAEIMQLRNQGVL